MDEEIEFNTPVLLATTPKYRYLFNALVPSAVLASDLSNAVIDIAHTKASTLELDLNSNMLVGIYKLVDSLGPVDDQPTATPREQFEIIDDTYLDAKARLLAPTTRLHSVTKPENLVAVLRLPPRKWSYADSESHEALQKGYRNMFAAIAAGEQRAPMAATPSNLIKRQRLDSSDRIHNARPLELNAAPIRIYHPAFTHFLDRITTPYDKLPLTPEDLTIARALVAASAEYYHNEDDRIYAIEKHFRGAVQPNTLTSTRSHTDSFLMPAGMPSWNRSIQNTPLVTALTNEIGDGGRNPAAQAMFDYVSFVVHPKRARLREVSCCPAFLLAIAGQHVSVHGAIFADQPVVQALTDYVTFGAIEHIERPPSGSDNNQGRFGRISTDEGIIRAARLLYALRLGVQELKEYYQQLDIPSAPSPSNSESLQHYPFLTTLQSEAYGELTLLYVCRLAKDIPSKAVFRAAMTTTNGDTREERPVVVKFTPSYNGDAHTLLAGFTPPLAPKLWHCKWENEIGLFVVVTDLVEGKTFKADEVLSDERDIGSLRTAVQTLHEKNWVFGDLRMGNVLVAADGVRLINFDWCKMDGQGRYPADINMDDIKWHPDVKPVGTMKKAHDAFMFEALTEQKL